MVKKIEDLILWQKAHQLVLDIYLVTKRFPQSEIYGITTQLRRAAASIPANISEGFVRKSNKEKYYFCTIADGSLAELKYFLILSKDLEYILITEYNMLMAKAEEVGKVLNGWMNSMKK